ncbi:MAG: hypothetical protein AAF694_21125 [Bacteroidota bacterium]
MDRRWELIVFPLICILASWLALSQTTQVNLWVLVGVIAIPISIASLLRPDIGLLSVISIAFLLPGLEEMAGLNHLRIGFDVLLLVNVVGTLIYIYRHDVGAYWTHWLGIFVGLWMVYALVILGKFPDYFSMTFLGGIEQYVFPGLMFWVALYAMHDLKSIRLFTHFLLSIGVIVAIYGLLQKFIGTSTRTGSELLSDPALYASYYINGRFRIDSFFADPTLFGISMASLAVFAYVNLVGPWRKNNLAAYMISLPIFISAMVFSRTASAYIVIGVGLLLFLLLSFKKHLVWGICGLFLVGIGFFSLNHSSEWMEQFTPVSIESASATSMSAAVASASQMYLFGEGYLKELSEGNSASIDNIMLNSYKRGGFDQIAWQLGWVGVAIFALLILMVFWIGIRGFAKSRDIRVRNSYLVYLVSVFVWVIANYYYPVLTQIPISIVFMVSAAILVKLGQIEHVSD